MADPTIENRKALKGTLANVFSKSPLGQNLGRDIKDEEEQALIDAENGRFNNQPIPGLGTGDAPIVQEARSASVDNNMANNSQSGASGMVSINPASNNQPQSTNTGLSSQEIYEQSIAGLSANCLLYTSPSPRDS